ncbi:penicillin acylase family protein [Budviciaceae bacterium BWR-B9]|uniref:Penicillin acylase family protein n=1 Tax=Limnobaculum allomyrinae TaxID=2791986 RepID=A0ABS1IQ01_9GAMM|nr:MULTISPECIES: penicillin acylase family protein [Limnobaculum]MBK5143818.1 penicillin acylase family protein [Limnobaculum allomyrinae]MBV7693557.1 penicillin acylase family protein [Limnobaculum sp. M2-1]
MKTTQLKSPRGDVRVMLENPQQLTVQGSSDKAVFFGQGYGAARLRLWQLDLSRRVATGTLSEIMGNGALRTDIFQRRLGLVSLAQQAESIDAGAEPSSWQGQQYQHIQAYVAGINQALVDMKLLPVECLLLRYRPASFQVRDAYLLAQLKYFINSAWQYELFHTRLSGRLTPQQHKQLLTTVSQEGNPIPPLPLNEEGERLAEVEEALRDGLLGMQHLGLASPDTGSNVIAIGGQRTVSGKPILAADPHMGHVNPGYNLMCKLESDEGLYVIGSHFPGVPGIIVGRNHHAAWGMVGIMADNQDLFWGKINLAEEKVETTEGWVPLKRENQTIQCKSGKTHEFTAYGFSQGRLLSEKGDYGLFLRWPSLDHPEGDISFYSLAKCHNWETFRSSLAHVHNSPMMVGYADIHGDIGLQTMGFIPKRKTEIGSLILNLTNPDHQWQGYVPYEALPFQYNPPEGYAVYANQYSEALFSGKCALSNRWHPPSRALRVSELIEQTRQHDLNTLQTIQDDKIDVFARRALTVLLPHLSVSTPLSDWDGDTQEIAQSQLFDSWMQHLADKLLRKVLKRGSRALYSDFWPGCRWNMLTILQYHLTDWGHEAASASQLVQDAYYSALAATQHAAVPEVEFQHSIKRPAWLRNLLTGRYPYQGGNRETIHATRQNTDFLTQSQTGTEGPVKSKPYTFGPGFKLLCDLSDQGEVRYMMNTPAKGSPFFWQLAPTLQRWQQGQRWSMSVSDRKNNSK